MSRTEIAQAGRDAATVFGTHGFEPEALERFRPAGRIWPDAAVLARLNVAKLSTGLDLLERVERARRHRHDNLDRHISLRELGVVASLSSFHLARSFKLAFGAAPISYHRALRLERAAHLLRRGNLTVAEIADRVGYSDAVAFTHAFRKHFGFAPRHLARPLATICDRS